MLSLTTLLTCFWQCWWIPSEGGFPKFKIFPIQHFSQLGQMGGALNFQFFQNSKKSKLSWGSGSGKLYTFSTFLSFRLMWGVTKSDWAYDLEAEILALFQNLTIFGFPKKGNKLWSMNMWKERNFEDMFHICLIDAWHVLKIIRFGH